MKLNTTSFKKSLAGQVLLP